MDSTIVRMKSKSVLVRLAPDRHSLILCSYQRDCIVRILDQIISDEGTVWVQTSCGWFATRDASGVICSEACDDSAAQRYWNIESQNRKRLAAAIGQMLTKSQSLKMIRKTSTLIAEQAKLFVEQHKSFMNEPEISIEDILVTLNSSSGLKSHEILGLIKIVSAQQSDPYKSLVDITTDIQNILNLRPTLWVKKNLGILETADARSRNDQFVMAAARGEIDLVKQFLNQKQELTAIHSELQYTALHAAADFGSYEVVKLLLDYGIVVNIRDARMGRTALHFAAQSGRLAIARLLLDYGLERDIQDFNQMVAYEIAHEHGQFECREVLKYLPPEVQYCQILDCSAYTITLRWTPPVTHSKIHARIDEFLVVHEYLEDTSTSTASMPTSSSTSPAVFPETPGQPSSNKSNVIAVKKYISRDCSLSIAGLQPASGHAFVIYSRSVAGMSNPSARLIFFTLPAMPDAPPQVEMLKVTKNGLVLAWHAPPTDNGAKLDMYQIEMCADAPLSQSTLQDHSHSQSKSRRDSKRHSIHRSASRDSADESELDNDNDNDDGEEHFHSHKTNYAPFSTSSTTSSSLNELNRMDSKDDKKGNKSDSHKSHHRKGTEKLPAISGAGTAPSASGSGSHNGKWHRVLKHRNVSVREKYLMGLEQNRDYYFRVRAHNEFGWSEWSVWAGPYTPQEGVLVKPLGEGLMGLTWISPELTLGRKVLAYEVQACRPSGPKTNSISVFKLKERSQTPIATSTSDSFDFVTLFDNLTEPRVTVTGLIPGRKYQFRVRPNIDGEWGSWDVLGVTSDVVAIPAAAPDAPTDVKEKTDVIFGEDGEIVESNRTATHNSVVVTWINGVPNGSPVLEFEIQMALVQPYRVSEEDNPKHLERIHQKKKSQSKLETKDLYVNGEDFKLLEWVDVTNHGEKLSSTTFHAQSLLPGAAYVFRVRQKNSVGWSPFSTPSPIIQILMVSPPSIPRTLSVSTYYAIIEWDTSSENFKFSTLEYDVEVAVVFVGQERVQNSELSAGTSISEIRWLKAVTRPYDDPNASNSNPSYDPFNCHRVLVDQLCPLTNYVTRVRVRTVAGWSVWSEISEPFRTFSPP